MKKMILTVLAVTVLFTGLSFGDYYNRHNPYKNFAYADYEFQHSNAAFHINRYKGDIYYFHHYRANVYFVLVGPNTFVVPALTFRAYEHRPNFVWVGNNDFVALSAANLSYYDSHVRFNYYFRYYDQNPYNVRNHVRVTRNYRKFYKNRRTSKRYNRSRTSVIASRDKSMKRARVLRSKRSSRAVRSRTVTRRGSRQAMKASYKANAARRFQQRIKSGARISRTSNGGNSSGGRRAIISRAKASSKK